MAELKWMWDYKSKAPIGNGAPQRTQRVVFPAFLLTAQRRFAASDNFFRAAADIFRLFPEDETILAAFSLPAA